MSVRWLYLDLNSFFASCEQQDNPALRGKPVAVLPTRAETTSAIAASYEAKKFGVKTGTRVSDARALCPGIVFVHGRHRNYTQYHHKILAAVEKCVPIEQVHSIDEMSCRLTGDQQNVEVAQALARKIKRTIAQDVGECLTSSIGLAPSPYLGKVASDMQKPDGLITLTPDMLPHALYRMELRDLCGIGPRMEKRLHRHGVFDVETLCGLSALQMRTIWGGVGGLKFHMLLRGEEIRHGLGETKSIGHQHVLEPRMRTPQDGLAVLGRLLSKAAERMRGQEFYCRRMSVHVKLTRHAGYFTQEEAFTETQDTAFLLNRLNVLWRDYPKGAAPLRVGVTLSGFVPVSAHQLSLFEKPKNEKLLKAVDALNQRYGRGTVAFGLNPSLEHRIKSDKIAFQRVPELYEMS